ncbi:7052_t:CDS:2 [Paraglomus occultum]|uniref:7052_t:CDS:1 n=1 Tax=Paraglomus occultum TaxID=144539 RepID=A0A9N8ZNA6_9GLOM|nr:7052_t:CDS:2 [Paraglomus occultum]
MPLLKNVSFTIPSVAIVGPSGGGKSTILHLLFRFFDVQGGHILDIVLFSDTVKYNVKYGKFHATDRQVARAAQIHDKISDFLMAMIPRLEREV